MSVPKTNLSVLRKTNVTLFQGYWSFVQPRLNACTDFERLVKYVGRGVSPSTATGNKSIHKKEFETFMNAAMKP